MGSLNEEEEITVPKKDFKIFGKSISEIPCFRNSFLCGIYSGVAGGLITFMVTSKAVVSSHAALASLWVGVFVYWIPCRYKFEKKLKDAELVRQAFNQSGKLKVRAVPSSEGSSDDETPPESTEKE